MTRPPDSLEESTEKIFFDHTARVRAEFERVFKPELKTLFSAIDAALAAEMAADKVLLDWPKDMEAQKAFCLAALRKALNDILGGLEEFRSGYFDLAQGALRSALEGFATAVLVNEEKEVCENYRKGRYSANDSVLRMLRHKKIGITTDQSEQIKAVYNRLHKMAHPSALALAVQMDPAGNGFPIGGSLYKKHLPHYRSVLAEMQSLAGNIEGFIKTRFGSPTAASSSKHTQ